MLIRIQILEALPTHEPRNGFREKSANISGRLPPPLRGPALYGRVRYDVRFSSRFHQVRCDCSRLVILAERTNPNIPESHRVVVILKLDVTFGRMWIVEVANHPVARVADEFLSVV